MKGTVSENSSCWWNWCLAHTTSFSPDTYRLGHSPYRIICWCFRGLLFHAMHRVGGTQGIRQLGDISFYFCSHWASHSMIAALILSKARLFFILFFLFFFQMIGLNYDLGKSIIPHGLRLSEHNACSSVLWAFLVWRDPMELMEITQSKAVQHSALSLWMLTAEHIRVMNPSSAQAPSMSAPTLGALWKHSLSGKQERDGVNNSGRLRGRC